MTLSEQYPRDPADQSPCAPRVETFKIRGPGVTSEGWSPCAPLLVTYKGRQYYVACIAFCLLDGRGIARNFGSFNTWNEAENAAIAAAKTEPRPALSEIVG